MKRSICVLAVVALCGCTLFGGHDDDTSYKYPKDIYGMCKEQRDAARGCIQDRGLKLSEKANRLSVEPRPGEKNFGGEWGWRAPEWGNQWVVGLTYDDGGGRYRIVVGTDPRTGQGVQPQVIKHEHGHFWLMSNYDIYAHDRRFSSCFSEWRDLRVSCQSLVQSNGTRVIIDFVDNPEDFP